MDIKRIVYVLFFMLVGLTVMAQPARIKPPTKPQTSIPEKPQKRVTQVVKASYNDGLLNVNGVLYKMTLVDGGTFQMGSNNGASDEKPVHSVTLNDYYIGQTEVTQALWKAVTGTNPSNWKGDDLPVEKVSWKDCQTFIAKLNQQTGQKFRLPTEAEWEYAARGGNKSKGYQYAGSNTLGDVAWYDNNSGYKTHPVATKQPNELNLYDMSGNVLEWCQDWYDENYYKNSPSSNPTGPASGSNRVCLGGSWSNTARDCRVGYRDYAAPLRKLEWLGLRLALTSLEKESK